MFHAQDNIGKKGIPAFSLPVFLAPGMADFVQYQVNPAARAWRKAKEGNRLELIRTTKEEVKYRDSSKQPQQKRARVAEPSPAKPLPTPAEAVAAITAAGMQPAASAAAQRSSSKQEVEWVLGKQVNPPSIWDFWTQSFADKCAVDLTARRINLCSDKYCWRKFKDHARTIPISQPGTNFSTAIKAIVLLLHQQIAVHGRSPSDVFKHLEACKGQLGNISWTKFYQALHKYLESLSSGKPDTDNDAKAPGKVPVERMEALLRDAYMTFV